MVNESVKPKQSASEKITAILNKLDIGDAIDAWQEAGDTLHKRIEDSQNILSDFKKKLPSKES